MEANMIESTETEVAAIGIRLIDDAYLAWFSAESESENALRGWFQATGERRAGAYVAYRAAVDREEAAARDLQRLWRLAESYPKSPTPGNEGTSG
jgi:hypothetical protein